MDSFPRANVVEQVNGVVPNVQVVEDVTLTGAGTVDKTTHTIQGNTSFLWTKAVAVLEGAGAFRHRLFAKWESRYLDDNPVRSAGFWGTGANPHKIPMKWMPLGGVLGLELEATSGTPIVQLLLHGVEAQVCDGDHKSNRCTLRVCLETPWLGCDRARYGPGRGLLVRHTGTTGVVVQNGAKSLAPTSDPPSFENDVGSGHFRVIHVTGERTSDLARSNLTFKDPRKGKREGLARSAMRLAGWIGTAQDPHVPSSPPVISDGSTASLEDLEDLTSGADNTIHVALIGECGITDQQLADGA